MRRVYALEVYRYPTTKEEATENLEEFRQLILASNLHYMGGEIYQLRDLSTHTFVGKGKLDMLKPLLQKREIDLVAFDMDAKPYQIKNIEDFYNIEVADRTRIILEIFKKRAQSREGKLQVELAEAQYETGRLVGGRGVDMSGQGKGVLGAGEAVANTQRKAYKRKIGFIKKRLIEVKQTRVQQNQNRRQEERPLISMVGYTNAGKSTLLNALTKREDVVVRDQLFTTVDPTTRKIFLGETQDGGRQFAFLTDTVGFIRKLPHELVDGFESTLDMVATGDLVLMVVDASDPRRDQKEQVVLDTLDRIGSKVPILRVYNKVDQLAEADRKPLPDTVWIAAEKGTGLQELKDEIKQRVKPLIEKHSVTY